jgi:1-aminocyclopropane-1-carboxylate deaminase
LLVLPTPCEPFTVQGQLFHIKRDDLSLPHLSGNKYRKLYTLLHTPSEAIESVVSYGGVQSNAMLSIAAVCRLKGWRFEYTAKSLPGHLKINPTGNLRLALELGMHLNEVAPDSYAAVAASLLERSSASERVLYIPQGGADVSARQGIDRLADEIRSWFTGRKGALTVVTPSGTGTTAAFLAEALPEFTVATTPAVGDEAYLVQQIEKLLPMPSNLTLLNTRQKYRFATPHADLFEMYNALKKEGIEFDLIYAPVMWIALLENMPMLEGEILYVHSGGVSGNETMLARYARMGLVAV